MLVYKQKPTLVINYKRHEGSIIKKLLKITKKIPQLRKAAKRTIQKSQAELNRKFKRIKIQIF